MRGIQLVNAMLDRHFLRRWRDGLVIQTAATDPQQIGLRSEGQRLGVPLDQRPAIGMAQDDNFFFKKLTWVVRRPISV